MTTRTRTGWVTALVAAVISTAGAQDLRQPPGEKDRAKAETMGWKAAASAIGTALGSSYQPGRSGVPGSVGKSAFCKWLRLQQWCELVSRDERDEVARMLGWFLFTLPGQAQPVFVASGQRVPDDALPVPADTLRQLVVRSGVPRALARHVIPEGYQPGSGSLAEALDPGFVAAMTRDDAFLESFFTNLSPRDFTPLVLKRLEEIWKSQAGRWADYRNLAIAIAFVTDQRPPEWWPHPQVRTADVPRVDRAAAELFQAWIEANESGRLLTDLRRMDAGELKFVVDAPIAQSELEWAQANVRFPRAQFGRAFSSIDYREDRLTTGVFDWNEGPYTLEAISRLGGICVDQAYFAMIAGKARGLPTLYFSGQGADGGHAWFGYLKAEKRWDMDCGRYENQNYAVGEALDPQTWLPINDHELVSLASSFRESPQYRASQADLAMARMFEDAGDLARADAALESAIAVCPRNDAAWTAKGEFMERKEVALRERRAFHEAALKQFANNQDVKVAHQRALASIARSAGDEATARKVEAGIISQNRRGRSDLSVTTAAQQLQASLDAGRMEEAIRDYRALLGRLGRSGGGEFFYQIVRPFSRTLAKKGNRDSAMRAVELARNTLRPEAGSVLDQDLRKLEDELSGASSADGAPGQSSK